MMKKSNIDNVQRKSIDEHFQQIMAETNFIDADNTIIKSDDLPEWFDENLFKKGQRYFSRNILGITAAYTIGLVAVFLVPTISKILVGTNQSSTSCAAFKRYFQTAIHIWNMQLFDVLDSDSKFYKSINVVKLKHSYSSKKAIEKTGEGILMRDMVLTQFSFIGYVLLSPKLTALTNDSNEREGITHFWRVIGHLLGIPDRLNICRKNEFETTLLCKKIRDEVYKKYLEKPDSVFYDLTHTALDGFKCIDPSVDVDVFLVFFYEAHEETYPKKISLYSSLNLFIKKLTLFLIGTPIIGVFLRNFWNYYLRIAVWIYEKYPIVAWIRYGKQNSKMQVYPHAAYFAEK